MKKVFITGISRGNGNALARQFLDSGWRVYGTSVSGEAPFVHEHLTTYALDLSQPEQIQALVKKVAADDVRIDILINNAGINLSTQTEYPTKTLSVDTLRKTLEVNLIGLVDLTERLLPFVAADGQIIAISSGAGASHPFIFTGSSSYQISKAALNMYTMTLAARLKESGVTVWSFDPGWLRTAMGSPQAPKSPEEAAKELHALVQEPRPAGGTFWTANKQREW